MICLVIALSLSHLLDAAPRQFVGPLVLASAAR